MTLPTPWVLVPVTGTFVDRSGAPCVGSVVFDSGQIVVVDGVTVVPRAITAVLDANGHFSVNLPASDDPHLNLQAWAYTVIERFASGRLPYAIFVPYTSTGIDLATAAPVVPPPELVSTRGPAGPANVLTPGTITTGAPGTNVTCSITGTTPNQLLNLSIPQGMPGSATYLWGLIDGNIADQTDLIALFNTKANTSALSAVALSGSYNDLGNKPTLFANPMTAAWQMIVGGAGGAPAQLPAPGSPGQTPTSQSDGSIVWASPTFPGADVYSGVWDASTGSPPSESPSKGQYWIVSVAGATDLSGNDNWQVHDWAIYDGTQWDQIVNDRVGLLLSAQNLGDLSNVTIARANLGLGSAALQNVSYFATAAQGALASTAVQPGALATVATSGAYNDLTGKPTLFVNPMSNVGDLIIGGTAGAPTQLTLAGALTGWVPTYNGTTIVWAAPAVLSVAGLSGTITISALQTALSLGSAAYTASSAYATSAQGALAASALQPDAGGQLATTARSRKLIALGNITGATTINLASGAIITGTMTGNCTFSFSNLPGSGYVQDIELRLTQDATGSRVATWPANGKWPGAAAFVLTTAANDMDVVGMSVDSSGNWIGYPVEDVG